MNFKTLSLYFLVFSVISSAITCDYFCIDPRIWAGLFGFGVVCGMITTFILSVHVFCGDRDIKEVVEVIKW